jgi:hypothetical protein
MGPRSSPRPRAPRGGLETPDVSASTPATATPAGSDVDGQAVALTGSVRSGGGGGLNYEDEESRVDPQRRLPSAPAGPSGRSGTYMVWRKLHQDVALFRAALRDAARVYEHGDAEKLAAKIVGRWRNGTPLVVSPNAEQPGLDPKPPGSNDFRYSELDADGRCCPLGAHIRRSNPRDALGFAGQPELSPPHDPSRDAIRAAARP